MEGLIASAGRDGNEMDRRCRRGGQKENERRRPRTNGGYNTTLISLPSSSFYEKKNNKRARGSPFNVAASRRIELAISNRTSLQRLR